jgi:hypothetical protein
LEHAQENVQTPETGGSPVSHAMEKNGRDARATLLKMSNNAWKGNATQEQVCFALWKLTKSNFTKKRCVYSGFIVQDSHGLEY